MKVVIVAFPNTTEAMMMQVCASRYGLPGRIIPIPHQLSAGCGMAWAAPAECEALIQGAIKAHRIRTEGFTVMDYGLERRHG